MSAMLLDRLGVAGVVGIGLLLFALSFHLGSIVPAMTELGRLKRETSQLQARMKAAGSPAEASREVAGAPSAIETIPERMRTLTRLATQRGIASDRVTYLLAECDGQPCLEVMLPLRAGYPALRAFFHDLLAQDAAVRIDDLALKRAQSSDPQVEAVLRLSYPLAAS